MYVCSELGILTVDRKGNASSFIAHSAGDVTVPAGICYYDKNKEFFMTDCGNGMIHKISSAGHIETIAGRGVGRGLDGAKKSASFDSPCGITVNQLNGDLYVSDKDGHTIRKVTQKGRVATVAGVSRARGCVDGPAKDARFRCPTGLAFDETNECLYIADSENYRIRMLDLKTGLVSTFAGSGECGNIDGVNASAQFFSSTSVIIRRDDRSVVVVDGGAIRRIRNGRVQTIAGCADRGDIDGMPLDSKFKNPYGICCDEARSTYYITEYSTGKIRKLCLME